MIPPHLGVKSFTTSLRSCNVPYHAAGPHILTFTRLLEELSRVPPPEGSAALASLTAAAAAGVDPLETDTKRVPWEFAVHFDESDAVGERDLASAATAIVYAHKFQLHRLLFIT